MITPNLRSTASLLLVVVLAACGGGGSSGGDGSNATPLVGVYEGTTSTGRNVTAAALSDGQLYVIYSKPGSSTAGGVVHGTISSFNGNFSSTSLKDYNMEGSGLSSTSMNGTYSTKSTVSGSIAVQGSAPSTFNLTYNSDWDAPVPLAAVAGDYFGSAATLAASVERGGFTVDSNGSFTIKTKTDCSITGTLVPRSEGNAFDAQASFGPAPCAAPNANVAGAAYYAASSEKLTIVLPSAALGDVLLLATTKVQRFPMTTTSLSLPAVGETSVADYVYNGSSFTVESLALAPDPLYPNGSTTTLKTRTTMKDATGATVLAETTSAIYASGCIYEWLNKDGGYVDPADPSRVYRRYECDGLATGQNFSMTNFNYSAPESNNSGIRISGNYSVVGTEYVYTELGAIEAFKILFSEIYSRSMTASGSYSDFSGNSCSANAGDTVTIFTQSGTVWFSPANGTLKSEMTQVPYLCNSPSSSLVAGSFLMIFKSHALQ